MFKKTFYHKTLRKYVTLFGTLFNNIYINRVDGQGTTVDTLKVPIYYGPKQKTLERVDQDANLNRPAESILPRMAFEMSGLSYDPSRKLQTTNKGFVKKNPDNNKLTYVYNPVPYNIGFNLYIMVKNAEDGTRILEQILPYFTPDWTATVNLIADTDALMDVPLVIGDVSVEDTYEGSVADRRTLIWTISFTMKGYLFGPVSKPDTGVITLAKVDFFASMTSNTNGEYVNIYPGMLANGSPTTNATLTVDRSQISADDDWDFIIERGDINNG